VSKMEEINISSGTSALNVTAMYNLLYGLFFFICLLISINGCNGLRKWVASPVNCNPGGWRWFRLKSFKAV